MQQIQTPENRDYKQNDDIETKEKKDRENKKQTEKLILTHRMLVGSVNPVSVLLTFLKGLGFRVRYDRVDPIYYVWGSRLHQILHREIML